MKQIEIRKNGYLHDDKGNMKLKGYSKKQIVEYHREALKVAGFMIKEWDYYAVLNEKFGLALTIADNGYLGFISMTFFDFTVPTEYSKTIMTILPLGKFKMPSTSKEGDVIFENKDIKISFSKKTERRILRFDCRNFWDEQNIAGKIELIQPTELESIVIATPFQKKKRFYYNQKINCMKASGTINFNGNIYDFGSEESYGVLDWGRGVWTYKNTWYWGSASGSVKGKRIGLNLGYGFGDTSAATENAIFFDGKTHKTKDVLFDIPTDEFLKQWKISSSDQRINLNFTPLLDRSSKTNVLFLCSDQHQVFGHYNGTVVLDNKEVIEIVNLFGFAEKVHNKW